MNNKDIKKLGNRCANEFVHIVMATIPDVVGVYLHGSLAMDCFSANSDIDVIVVVENSIERALLKQFAYEIISLEDRFDQSIEVSIVTSDSVVQFKHPSEFIFHYSAFHRERYQNDPEYLCGFMVDDDLAAHFNVIKFRGETLYGVKIEELFIGNYDDAYWDSIVKDIQADEAEVMKNPVYYILNYCRVLAYKVSGQVLSKAEGGKWAVKYCYNYVVEQALEDYETCRKSHYDERAVMAFRTFIFREIFKV